MAYWFYFSYARNDSSSFLKRFFADLNDAVRARSGQSENIGFFDERLAAGDEWSSTILNSIQESRILVAMLSPSYINSEYCGKELQVFLTRQEQFNRASGTTGVSGQFILPILWLPLRTQLPPAVARIQYLDPSFPPEYSKSGLLSYVRRRAARSRNEYQEMLDVFARRITDLGVASRLPRVPDIRSLEDVPSAFAVSRAVHPVDEAGLLQKMSMSARRVLGLADALRTEEGQAEVHVQHLVAALFAKPDGPVRALLVETGIDRGGLPNLRSDAPAGDLPNVDWNKPTAPLESIPPGSPHVREALAEALASAADHGSATVRVRHIGYGVLSIRGSNLIETLVQAGVRPELLLLDEVAVSAGIVLPGYRSDDPAGRRDKDRLDVEKEVRALCAVLAAKDVEPPLSLGLFGDWGSGKSFFMRQMERRIHDLATAAKTANGRSPYCADIVQLKFNAWHYVDTDLWASLAAHIFDGLAKALAEDGSEETAQKRARLLAATTSSRDVLTEAEQRKSEADAELQATEQRLKHFERTEAQLNRNLGRGILLRAVARVTLAQPLVREQLGDAARALNAQEGADAANKLGAELLELRGIWGRAKAIWLAIRNGRRVWLLSLALVAVVVVGCSLIVPWAVSLGLNVFVSSLAGAVAIGLAALSPFVLAAQRALAIVERVRRDSSDELDRAKTTAKAELQAEHVRARNSVTAAHMRVADARNKVKALENLLLDLRYDQQMADFIRDRNLSDVYTRHLGTIGRAREDFERLSTLLTKVREEHKAKRDKSPGSLTQSTSEPDLPRIDRIVLYIDDLDRCPENKVVDVLQAVHLLLAFPLFVVVVGVDPRWLLYSLQQHSAAFRQAADNSAHLNGSSDDDPAHWRSTPLNYLEKIFQIPFTLRPLEAMGFSALVDDLAEPSRTADQETASDSTVAPAPAQPVEATDTPNGSSVAETVHETASPSHLSVTSLPLGSAGATVSPSDVDLNPEPFQIQPWEREAMKKVHALIPSPRAAKRFVNVYRLLRAQVPYQRREAFIGAGAGGEHRAALLLLGIQVGHPDQAVEMLRALVEREHDETWWEFVDSFKVQSRAGSLRKSVRNGDGDAGSARTGSEYWRQLLDKLSEIRDPLGEDERLIPKAQSCADFRTWAPEVARYSFQSGRVLLLERSPMRVTSPVIPAMLPRIDAPA